MQVKPKIVLLDNNDSFTFNLVELLRNAMHTNPLVLPYDYEGEIPEADAYVFSPGPGLPSEKPLMRKVMEQYCLSKPILGICLGHQFIAEYYGAKLINLGQPNHGIQVHAEVLANSQIFDGIGSQMQVGLYHSWAIAQDSLANTAMFANMQYKNITMGIKHHALPILGFQFHPESFLTPKGHLLIENWLKHYVYPVMRS